MGLGVGGPQRRDSAWLVLHMVDIYNARCTYTTHASQDPWVVRGAGPSSGGHVGLDTVRGGQAALRASARDSSDARGTHPHLCPMGMARLECSVPRPGTGSVRSGVCFYCGRYHLRLSLWGGGRASRPQAQDQYRSRKRSLGRRGRSYGKAGLLKEAGIVLCQTDEAILRPASSKPGEQGFRLARPARLIRHDGPEHALVFAATRSGKGVGVVIPTLLSWPHSTIVHDIKKELWNTTAGWRRKFSRCWRFEPGAPDSIRYNPLLEVRRGDHEVQDVQNIADILIDPSGEKSVRSHWDQTAHALLVGTILHVLYAEPDKTLAGVANVLSDPNRPVVDTFDAMLRTQHLPTGPHPVVAAAARDMLNRAHEELSGVLSTAISCLTLYRDPLIARATSASDFRIADLMDGEHPASLYMVVPPSDLSRTRALIRLMLNQIGRRLCEDLGGDGRSAHTHRLLFLLDEFPALGRMEFFESALAFVAGYGIKCLLITQTLNQLAKIYGDRNSILDNCHVRLAFGTNDDLTARRISDLLGQATHTKTQRTVRGFSLLGRSNRSESEQEHPRPLLTPGEVTQLPSDEALLFVGSLAPYRAKKVIYYADERFRGRAKLPPPDAPSEVARELPPPRPSQWQGVVQSAPHPAASQKAPERVPPVPAAELKPGGPAAAEQVMSAAAETTPSDLADGWEDVFAGGDVPDPTGDDMDVLPENRAGEEVVAT